MNFCTVCTSYKASTCKAFVIQTYNSIIKQDVRCYIKWTTNGIVEQLALNEKQNEMQTQMRKRKQTKSDHLRFYCGIYEKKMLLTKTKIQNFGLICIDKYKITHKNKWWCDLNKTTHANFALKILVIIIPLTLELYIFIVSNSTAASIQQNTFVIRLMSRVLVSNIAGW